MNSIFILPERSEDKIINRNNNFYFGFSKNNYKEIKVIIIV
jgi:hypothetical protein